MTLEEWNKLSLNDAVLYAKGWNDAIQEAMRVVDSIGCGECDMQKIYIEKIGDLDKSMVATDD